MQLVFASCLGAKLELGGKDLYKFASTAAREETGAIKRHNELVGRVCNSAERSFPPLSVFSAAVDRDGQM